MLKILLIDDEPEVRHVVTECLLAKDFHIDAPAVEDIDISRFTERAAVEGRYDLIILDLRLPHLDPLGLVEAVRKLEAPPPIMILAGFLFPRNRKPPQGARSPELHNQTLHFFGPVVIRRCVPGNLGPHLTPQGEENTAIAPRDRLTSVPDTKKRTTQRVIPFRLSTVSVHRLPADSSAEALAKVEAPQQRRRVHRPRVPASSLSLRCGDQHQRMPDLNACSFPKMDPAHTRFGNDGFHTRFTKPIEQRLTYCVGQFIAELTGL